MGEGNSQTNYFTMQYLECALRNAVEMKSEVDGHHRRLLRTLAGGSGGSYGDIQKIADNSQKHLKLCEEVLNFLSEVIETVGTTNYEPGLPDSSDLLLLRFSPCESNEHGLGSFVKHSYQPPALPEGVCERCGCLKPIGGGLRTDDRGTENANEAENGAGGGGDVWRPIKGLDSPLSSTTDHNEMDINEGSGSTMEITDTVSKEADESPLSLSPPSSSPPESFLELQLGSMTIEQTPEPSLSSLVSLREPSLSNLEPLSLHGPDDQVRHHVVILPQELPSFSDALIHSSGLFVCYAAIESHNRGLWLHQSSTMEWNKVSESQVSAISTSYRGEEVFAVSGEIEDPWVKKFNLKTSTPLEAKPGGLLTNLRRSSSKGFFKVNGGVRLTGISFSPEGGLLAVADSSPSACRVTIHKLTGDKVCEVKGKFDGGRPWDVSWLSEYRVAVAVWGNDNIFQIGMPEGDRVIRVASTCTKVYCIQIPEGNVVWKSTGIDGLLMISCRGGKVYASVPDNEIPSFKVLSGESGQEIQQEKIPCMAGSVPVRVMDVDGVLTAVCCKWRARTLEA